MVGAGWAGFVIIFGLAILVPLITATFQYKGFAGRNMRDGAERQQWDELQVMLSTVSLSSLDDRWPCDLSGDGSFQVKEVRNYFDDLILPTHSEVTRWVKVILKKINILVWRARRDCLPTMYNLTLRDDVGSCDLWKACEAYGKVVDVFIPNRRSKSGKRFAFVRRMLSNLNVLAIRFILRVIPLRSCMVAMVLMSRLFVALLMFRTNVNNSLELVLDESCTVSRDLTRHVTGKVKDIESITNLRTLLLKEGFPNVNLSYLGGLWVLIELENVSSKNSLLEHVGVSSWFQILQAASKDFVSEERVVWVDIEGVPLNVWSRGTFLKIGNKWGKTLDIKDNSGASFARKRLCVLTKQPKFILENFKVIYKGKISMVRAKELFTWTLIFLVPQDVEYKSDDAESDGDGVSETVFGDNSSSHQVAGYKSGCADSPSLSHPTSFTPVVLETPKEGDVVDVETANNDDQEYSSVVNAKVMNSIVKIPESSNGVLISTSKGHVNNGGSILDVLEDMIRELGDIDVILDNGNVSEALLLKRMELMCQLHDINKASSRDAFQKSKVNWAIDGDENSKIFHGVKVAFKNHFQDHFDQPTPSRFRLNFPFHKRISPDQARDMDKSVSRDEIRNAVWDCRENKSPGPNGYSFEFFQKYWSFVGPDFCCAFEYFFDHGSFAKGCNSSFIAFIPKVTEAKYVSDFRPISLIGCVYKVLTKILANRLVTIISDIVSDTQSDFLAKRNILNGPFILNELLNVLKAFGFGPTWCNWIWGTLVSARASVLVNGSPTSEFSFHRGLKQGGVFNGIQINGSISISHLFYADDAMFIAQAVTEIGCKVLCHQFRYLGVTVGELMSRRSAWDDVVNKLRSRLSNWKVKTLSIGGRLTVLKSVLGASPLYYMSIFKTPKTVLKDLEAIRSKFSNGADSSETKITWIAWQKVLASMRHGGLGVSSYYALNRALILKWTSIWCFIIREVQVLKANGFNFISHYKIKVRNGCSTQFWLDHWLSDAPLREKFPRMFALDTEKEVTVADKLGASSLNASFQRNVHDGAELDGSFQVKEVRNYFDDLILPTHSEVTRWVKVIPKKINIFVWRARRDCLPTRHNLTLRGVSLVSDSCPLCEGSVEVTQHLFFLCPIAHNIFQRICSWCELDG
nr:RNA-directed DNA polymerase, eukaryota, reverse transcriptase zinc-binding domain protein [Tanacetum cinerariifolium]